MKRYYHFVFYLNFNLAINIDIAKNKTVRLAITSGKLEISIPYTTHDKTPTTSKRNMYNEISFVLLVFHAFIA